MEDYNWEALRQLIKDNLARVYIQKEGDVVTTAIDERGQEVELEMIKPAILQNRPDLKETGKNC